MSNRDREQTGGVRHRSYATYIVVDMVVLADGVFGFFSFFERSFAWAFITYDISHRKGKYSFCLSYQVYHSWLC